MSDLPLTHEHFTAFFKAVWGVDPFPWQADLLGRLATGQDPRRDFSGAPGEWPAVLDLPTGSGKTAALDIALFHLALEAGKGETRRAPVRIAFVVNRRLIVDDAHARAERLADVLAWSLLSAEEAAKLQADLEARRPHLVDVLRRVRAEPAVKCVASRLRELAGDGQPPLVARRLRGGTPREDDWARTPVQPTILCSTVDQVGSRLLFRGYGISDSMKPIHAGLLGSDCLILLDEAHLSEPFRQTLMSVRRLRSGDRERAPFSFAVLTATPGQEGTDRFGLSKADEDHPVLARRIEATKPARLVEKPGGKSDSGRADAVAEEAIAVLRRLQVAGVAHPAVGVVLNRVARARAAFERIEGELQDAAEVMLLIGPARAADRDALAQKLEPIRTGRDEARAGLDRPLVVVATQTIEAGVDIDFDGLVTEAAALDALRQRFGRLNRAGRDIRPEAAILVHKEDLAAKVDDPVYGDRIKATWHALKELASEADVVDFGIRALRDRIDGQAAALSTETRNAPVLMPAYAHLWSQTAPIPNADPEVALFLHGSDRSPASVQIVWRGDIDEARDLKPAIGDPAEPNAARERLIELLKLLPPRAAEAVEVPMWAARAWLERAGAGQADFSDAVEPGRDNGEPGTSVRRAFRWAGEDSRHTEVVYPSRLRNGDLTVVPATYGGCDEWGWHPKSAEKVASFQEVADVADAALWPYRGRRFAVRVTPELVAQSIVQARKRGGDAGAPVDGVAIAAELSELLAQHEGEGARSLLDRVLDWCKSKHEDAELPEDLDGVVDICLPVRLQQLSDRCKGIPRFIPCRNSEEETPRGIVFFAPRGLEVRNGEAAMAALPSTESDDLSVASDRAVLLLRHCDDVRAWAEGFAARAGLSRNERAAVALAAHLHDTGKAYWRYQAYFAGGDPYGPDCSVPLAKPGQRPPNGARERAGLPPRWRHEALSVRAAIAHPEFKGASDPLLVFWLIGTHHGHGRPLFPHADPQDVGSRPLPLPAALGGELSLRSNVPGPQSLAFDFEGLDWAQLFEALKERYGIWGLARLEAFIRLADHRASETGAPPAAASDRKEAAE